MMIQISTRLQAVAALVKAHGPLADVGCDHGYIPIYLKQTGQIEYAIALDINAGPLSKAKEHIARFQMDSYIQTRRCDGVQALHPNEVTTVVIAGMGGGLVMKILQEGKQQLVGVQELILQPQSEIERVRALLPQLGYQIIEEDMILEDGKYYPMMRVLPNEAEQAKTVAEQQQRIKETWQKRLSPQMQAVLEHTIERYGPQLLAKKNPILLQFLQKQQKQYEMILQKLEKQEQTEPILRRKEELYTERLECDTALVCIEAC